MKDCWNDLPLNSCFAILFFFHLNLLTHIFVVKLQITQFCTKMKFVVTSATDAHFPAKIICTPRFFNSAGRSWTRANLSPISVNVSMLMMVTYGVIGGFGLGLIYLLYQWMYLCWWLHSELWEGLVWTRTNLSPISVNVSMFMVTYGVIGGFGLGLIYLPAVVAVGHYFESKASKNQI